MDTLLGLERLNFYANTHSLPLRRNPFVKVLSLLVSILGLRIHGVFETVPTSYLYNP